MIEDLNRLITSQVGLRKQEAEATTRVNRNLIENYRDYIAFHEIDHKGLSEKQLRQTSKYCKTVRP